MKYNGKTFMNLGLMVVTGWMIITALEWPFKTALFPLIAGVPTFFLATVEFYLSLSVKKGDDRVAPTGAESVLIKRRTLSIFLWILGFFFLILFLGVPISVPLFAFLHLKFHGKERWRIVLPLTAGVWGFFYFLFVWLLNTPFPEGWIQRAIRIF